LVNSHDAQMRVKNLIRANDLIRLVRIRIGKGQEAPNDCMVR
jgi:hypothetical protein